MTTQNPAVRVSIKHNILANYVTQIYVMGIGIVMAPVYLHYMGTEAYGLIGFFTMMAAWFQLLDLGLTPTLVRETARFRGGAIGVDVLRAFLRTLEVIFGTVSVGGAVAVVLLADQIATRWLKVKVLPIEQVAEAVMLMGLTVPLRWMSGLYRGIVSGFERQVWLSGYNSFIATLRFVGVLTVFVTLGATPVHFFVYQLVVAGVELGGLTLMTYALVTRGPGSREKFSWKPLMGNLNFSLVIAFSATMWVVATQTDKLILSKLLPLANYGMFAIAVVVAGAINTASGPFGQALLPRLTKLVAESDMGGVARLYSDSTQAVCVLVVPAVAILTFFAGPILKAWTGNPQVAYHGASILCLYAVGNGFVALCRFPFYLQYAKGDLRLHFIGNIAFLILLVPLLFLAIARYGAIGAGFVWAGTNFIYAFTWIPIVHARFLAGQHWKWMMYDVLPIVVPTMLCAWLLMLVVPLPSGRWAALVVIAALGVVLLVIAGIGSSMIRFRALRLFSAHVNRFTSEQT